MSTGVARVVLETRCERTARAIEDAVIGLAGWHMRWHRPPSTGDVETVFRLASRAVTVGAPAGGTAAQERRVVAE